MAQSGKSFAAQPGPEFKSPKAHKKLDATKCIWNPCIDMVSREAQTGESPGNHQPASLPFTAQWQKQWDNLPQNEVEGSFQKLPSDLHTHGTCPHLCIVVLNVWYQLFRQKQEWKERGGEKGGEKKKNGYRKHSHYIRLHCLLISTLPLPKFFVCFGFGFLGGGGVGF